MKRKPGKQPGRGARSWPGTSTPDKTEGACFPDPLPRAALTSQRRRPGGDSTHIRSHSFPAPQARAVTIQHGPATKCSVRAAADPMSADAPPEAAGAPGAGNLRAELPGLVRVPARDSRGAVRGHPRVGVSGTQPATGGCTRLLDAARRVAAANARAIRALVHPRPGVACGDETPLRAGPGPKPRGPASRCRPAPPCSTYYSRRPGTLAYLSGNSSYSDLHGTVVVHDRYVDYNYLRRHQPPAVPAMSAAILKTPPRPTRTRCGPAKIAGALRGLIHQANLARDQGLAAVPRRPRRRPQAVFRRGCAPAALGLVQVRRGPRAESKQPGRARTWPGRRRSRRAAVPHRHRHPADQVQPSRTRPAARENPAGSGSEKTTRDRYAIRGYASTAAKHRIAVFTAIRDALAGKPRIHAQRA